MRSPIILIRLIFSCLLLYLNFTTLVFAAWNISAVAGTGLAVPGTQVLLVFTTSLSLVILILGLLPMSWSRHIIASVAFEIIWNSIVTLLQIVAALGSAASIAMMMRDPANPSIAVSSILLLPTSWFLSILHLAYFLTIFVASMVHARQDPDIWRTSVYDVKWFGYANSRLKPSEVGQPRPKSGYEGDSWTLHLEDIESSAARKAKHPVPSIEKPSWAPTTRRGVDPPFAARMESTPRSSASTESTNSVYTVETRGPQRPVGSRFIERFRDSQTISRPPTKPTAFPKEVDDNDKPIPLPRLSKWISAEALKDFGH